MLTACLIDAVPGAGSRGVFETRGLSGRLAARCLQRGSGVGERAVTLLPIAGELDEVARRHGLGKGVTLQNVATEAAQDFHMSCRFDAFGDDLDTLRAADIDDRSHEAALRTGGFQRGNELAVDFYAVRAELDKADVGGVAGAEVVDFNVDAEAI